MTATDANGAMTDHTGLRVMGTEECLERLGGAVIGRVAFVHDGDIVLLPVHHVLDGTDVCFRTSGNSKIEAAADHDPMSYEVDDYDVSTRAGWSVTVTGIASVVYDADVEAALEADDRVPWTVGDPATSVWIRIRPDAITGRELLPA